jgi:DNA repair protein RecO (recombination protein O)
VSRITLEPAFVLHHRPYRDTSLLLELLTASHGRVGVVARGARGPRSRMRGLLQPFRPLLVSWTGRGELGTLAGVELNTPSRPLPADRIMSGFYLNELLLKLLERYDPQPELFSHYAGVISALAECSPRQQAMHLRLFEKQLLDALGYGLNLTHESTTGKAVRADSCYRFRADSGPEAVGVGEDANTVSGASLLALASGVLTEAQHLHDARRVLRDALDQHLGGRALRTREVARATRRIQRAPGEAPMPRAAVPSGAAGAKGADDVGSRGDNG